MVEREAAAKVRKTALLLMFLNSQALLANMSTVKSYNMLHSKSELAKVLQQLSSNSMANSMMTDISSTSSKHTAAVHCAHSLIPVR